MAKLARWKCAFAVSFAILVAAAGCRSLPERNEPQKTTDPNAPSPSYVPPSDASLPKLPHLKPVSDDEALHSPRPTPILDGVATRDAELKRALLAPAPAPPPVSPPEAAVESLPTPDPGKTDLPEEKPSDERTSEAAQKTPPSDRDSCVAGLDELKTLARERAAGGGPHAPTWEARERFLSGLAEPVDTSVLRTVLTTLEPPPLEDKASEPVVEPPQVTPSAPLDPPFAIPDLRICKKVLGFGNVVPIDAQAIKKGATILLYCEVEGLKDEPYGEGVRSRLAGGVVLIPEGRETPVWGRDLGLAEDSCRRRRRDFYVNYRLTFPADLPSGAYELRLWQKDLIGNADAVRSVTIRLK